MSSSRPPYAGFTPGTPEWMKCWAENPTWQEEMLSYKSLIEMGINPIEKVEGFRVSNSALETVGCSVKALMKYGYRVSNPANVYGMQVGSAIHTALAYYFRTGEAEQAYQRFINAYPEGNAPEERLGLDNVKIIIHHYLTETLKHFPYYVHPSMVELWFEQALTYGGTEQDPEPLILTGRIDLLPEEPTSKALMVMDHKTTGKISDWWMKGHKMRSGLNGYFWAASRFIPQQLLPGCVINAVELPRLSAPGRKCRTHGVDYAECRKYHPNHQIFSVPSEPGMIEEWKRGAVFQARRLRDLIKTYGSAPEGVKYVRMLGKFNGMCTFCEFLDFCLADRPVEWIGTVYPRREDIQVLEG